MAQLLQNRRTGQRFPYRLVGHQGPEGTLSLALPYPPAYPQPPLGTLSLPSACAMLLLLHFTSMSGFRSEERTTAARNAGWLPFVSSQRRFPAQPSWYHRWKGPAALLSRGGQTDRIHLQPLLGSIPVVTDPAPRHLGGEGGAATRHEQNMFVGVR